MSVAAAYRRHDHDHADAVAAQGFPDDSAETMFLHDVPADVLATVEPPSFQTSTRFMLCRDDRLFPAAPLDCLVTCHNQEHRVQWRS